MRFDEYLYGAVRRQNRNTNYTVFSEDRHYIKSPADAPEGVQIQKGERGGLYYDTEGKTFRQDRVHLEEADVYEATEGAEYFVLENNLDEFTSMLPDLNDGEISAMRQATDSISRRNPDANKFSDAVLSEAQSRGLDTRLDPIPIGEIDEELISYREKQLRDLANKQNSLTLYHVTYPENTQTILQQGMIPGKKQPAAQDFQPKYLGNYMFAGEQGALQNYDSAEGNIDILKIDIPLNEQTIPMLARNLHPDEDASSNAFAPLEQTLDMSVALSEDIPAEWISVHKKAMSESYHPQRAQPDSLSPESLYKELEKLNKEMELK